MNSYNFDGTYCHALDQKNRVFIPAEYRNKLDTEFVVCTPPGSSDCIIIYPTEEWDRYFENLRNVCTGSDRALAERLANSTKRRVSADKQGRITLTPEHCRRAHLEKEAMIMGVGNRIEIWNPDIWNAIKTKCLEEPPEWMGRVEV